MSRSETSSELGVQTCSDHGNRSAIMVVARVDYKLIIGAEPITLCDRQAVIGLDDLLETGMRQFPVPDDDAEAAVIEKGLMHARDAVDDFGDPPSVLRSAPLFARNRKTGSNRSINIGEFERFDVAVRQPGAREETKVRR